MSINITDHFLFLKRLNTITFTRPSKAIILSPTTTLLQRDFPETFVVSNSLAQKKKTYGKRHFLNWKCRTKKAVLIFWGAFFFFSVCLSESSGKCWQTGWDTLATEKKIKKKKKNLEEHNKKSHGKQSNGNYNAKDSRHRRVRCSVDIYGSGTEDSPDWKDNR